jgi:hypothetical protein
MLGVLSTPVAKLRDLQPLLGVLFVLCRRIIPSFTLGTGQSNDFTHKNTFEGVKKSLYQNPFKIFGETKKNFLLDNASRPAPSVRANKESFYNKNGILVKGFFTKIEKEVSGKIF